MEVRQTDVSRSRTVLQSEQLKNPSRCESGDRSLTLPVGPILPSQGLMPGTLNRAVLLHGVFARSRL